MVELDLIGLLLSWLLLGPRYPYYVLFLTLFQETCRFLVAQVLGVEVLRVTLGGVFSATAISGGLGSLTAFLVLYSGPFSCYLISGYMGGLQREEGAVICNPWAVLANPLGVMAWRFFLFSTLFSTWRLLS